jgi:hypothetical protein
LGPDGERAAKHMVDISLALTHPLPPGADIGRESGSVGQARTCCFHQEGDEHRVFASDVVGDSTEETDIGKRYQQRGHTFGGYRACRSS